MGWIKIDNALPGCDKVLDLDPVRSNAAVGLHVLAQCYADAHRTDGVIPSRALRMITASPDWSHEVAELVRVGLWRETETGYAICDYLVLQRSSTELAKASELQRQRALKRWTPTQTCASGTADGNADQTRPEEDREEETRPVQTTVGGASHHIEAIRASSGGRLSILEVDQLIKQYGADVVANEAERLSADEQPGLVIRSWPKLLQHRLLERRPAPRAVPTPRLLPCTNPDCVSGFIPSGEEATRCPVCNAHR